MTARTTIGNITAAAVWSGAVTYTPTRPVLHHPSAITVPVTVTRIGPRPAVSPAKAIPITMSIMPLQRGVLAIINPHLTTVCGAIPAKFNSAQVTISARRAIVSTRVVVVVVAIITGLNSRSNVSVTAARCRAIRKARIGIAVVRIITRFDPSTHMTITTARSDTVRQATVVL